MTTVIDDLDIHRCGIRIKRDTADAPWFHETEGLRIVGIDGLL